MSTYRLLKHKAYEESLELLPPPIQRKATWAQVLLGMRGRTPSVKGTAGHDARWRRTPVQGNHYYMWWIPQSESGISTPSNGYPQRPSILIHSIRHHDQTDKPIQLGELDDYEEITFADLEPRFDEQKRISQQLDQSHLSVSTIKGLPGSGKTISLLYLVKDLIKQVDRGQILYITYTARLKRAAQEFLQAQDAQITERVMVRTLNEVINEILGTSVHPDPFLALRGFQQFFNNQSAANLGEWRRYPQTLYTEIRAHLLGQAFPEEYQLGSNGYDHYRFSSGFSAEAYAESRNVDTQSAQLAFRLAVRAASQIYFREQKMAQQALTQLNSGNTPAWLPQLGALVVDEIQDLTLLQIAFLGELAHVRTQQPDVDGLQFVFTVAGDESQIVQPSGFDWGTTKDLLAAQLDLWPDEYEFQHQRRSPRQLAELIDKSWNFYGHLPKQQRPSARRQSYVDEAIELDYRYESGGQIWLCSEQGTKTHRSTPDWESLLDELVDKPGRVIIDVDGRLRSTLATSAQRLSDEVLFLPREIKGLERATVIIHGLNSAYERAVTLCEEAAGNNIPRFEARRIFDELRVALSRSTNTLVLLEAADAPVLSELGLAGSQSTHILGWDELIDALRTEEMSDLEVIEGYLDEVEDLVERGRWDRAFRRNRRAHELAVRLGDIALQRETQEQHVQLFLQQAENAFQNAQWQEAHRLNRNAYQRAIEFGDPTIIVRVESQTEEFDRTLTAQAENTLRQAENWAERSSFQMAQRNAKEAQSFAELTQNQALQRRIDDQLADISWQWAYQLTEQKEADLPIPQNSIDHAIRLLDEAADVLAKPYETDGPANDTREDAENRGVQALHILSQRYRSVPKIGNLSAQQIESVLTLSKEYLQQMKPLNAEPDAYVFIDRWLEESFLSLDAHSHLYYRWAVVAELLSSDAIYQNIDDHLWELENRFAMQVDVEEWGEVLRGKRAEQAKFYAFILGYNGEAQAASVMWEKLGEFSQAAQQARKAGEIIRAYDLLRKVKGVIPNELAVAAKAIRLLDQLQQNHDKLLPAEQEALASQLADIQERMISHEADQTEVDNLE